LWALAAFVAQYVESWGLAIAAGLMAVFAYLITPLEQSPKYGLESEFSIDSKEFLSSMEGTTGVRFVGGNTIELLNNGDEFFPPMIDAIEHAEESVTIEAYIYWAGSIGLRIAKALAQKAKEGVRVRILLDAVGSSSIGNEILETLTKNDCKVEWYNPVLWTTLGRFNHRTHRKSLIIDGRIAFTGGAGIADHWLGRAQDPQHWRDIQIRIEGPGVTPLQTGFAQNWLNTTGELLSGEAYFPFVEDVGDIALQTIMGSPETGSSAVRIMYYLSIVSARHKVYLANPYFIPDEAAVEILIAAKKRGVDVKIMVAGDHNDTRLARYSSLHLYGQLLEAGIEIYEYCPTMMHQKTMVVDGRWATVGTTNFDNRSFALNEENNVCAYDVRVARSLEDIFLNDLKVCRRVDYEAWKRRGVMKRVFGALALFLKEQI
jgi:cardiolipin synthase